MKIGIKEAIVFDGYAGWDHHGINYKLACGAALAQAVNGDILCTWLSGNDHEPAEDNCVLLSRSTDGGKTWSVPGRWIPAGKMAGAGNIMPYATGDGRLIALGANWPVEKLYTQWHYFRMESKDNGYTWSDPESIKLREDNNASLCTPIKLKDGSAMFPAQFFEQRRVPLTGPVEKLAYAATEAEALALPAEDGKVVGGKFSTHLHGCSVFVPKDENLKEFTEYGHIDNRPLGLLEPTMVQLKDGRLVMLMRAEWGGFLWRAESADNGRTWTTARQTDIPNPTSLAHLFRLQDGRVGLIHNNSGGVIGEYSKRDPLSIWISDDEIETWAIKKDVITGGSLSYPNCMVLKDGRLVFCYDFNRRQVRFVEVEL